MLRRVSQRGSNIRELEVLHTQSARSRCGGDGGCVEELVTCCYYHTLLILIPTTQV